MKKDSYKQKIINVLYLIFIVFTILYIINDVLELIV